MNEVDRCRAVGAAVRLPACTAHTAFDRDVVAGTIARLYCVHTVDAAGAVLPGLRHVAALTRSGAWVADASGLRFTGPAGAIPADVLTRAAGTVAEAGFESLEPLELLSSPIVGAAHVHESITRVLETLRRSIA